MKSGSYLFVGWALLLTICGASTSATVAQNEQGASAKGRRGKSVAAASDGKKRGTAVSPDYVELARVLSNAYGTAAEGGALRAESSVATDLIGMIGRLSESKSDAVRGAVAKLEAGRGKAVRALKNVDNTVAEAQANQDRVLGAAADGAYSKTIDYEYRTLDREGREVTMRSQTTVDESGLPVFGALALNLWVQSQAPARAKAAVVSMMEEARLRAWVELFPKLAAVYPMSHDDAKLIQFRITAPQAGKKPGFVAVNEGKTSLTNVTLRVDLVHFTTAPETSSLQVYFVPRWEKGQAIHLPVTCVRNVLNTETGKSRPLLADPDPKQVHPQFGSETWLGGVGGVIEIQSQAWAEEARQPKTNVSFPAHGEMAARWELKIATHLAKTYLSGQLKNQPPNYKVQPLAADSWPVRAARRVLTFVPADSVWATQARTIVDEPGALFRTGTRGSKDEFLKRTKPGTTYLGDWSMLVKGFGPGVPRGIRDSIGKQKDAKGKLELRIESQDEETGRISAVLSDPHKAPERRHARREIRGEIMEDYTGQWILYFPAPTIFPDHPMAMNAEWLDFHAARSELTLIVKGDGFSGESPGPSYPMCFGFSVTLQPGESQGASERTVAESILLDGEPTDQESVFPKGSVWRGKTWSAVPPRAEQQIEIVVTGRKGETFSAQLRQNGKPLRDLEGIVKDGKITWQGARGETNPGRPHEGTITGKRIETKYFRQDKPVMSGPRNRFRPADGHVLLERIEEGN